MEKKTRKRTRESKETRKNPKFNLKLGQSVLKQQERNLNGKINK